MAFVNEREKYRVADYERNAFLYRTGGAPYGEADFFEMDWNGNIIKFTAEANNSFDNNERVTINWTITQYSIPEVLTNKYSEINILVFEALREFGFNFHKEYVNGVSVQISPSIQPM